jgi:hypothetical protein
MRTFKTAEECLRLAADCRLAADSSEGQNKARWLQLASRWADLAQARGSNLVPFSIYQRAHPSHDGPRRAGHPRK